ncbi:MAG TPA: efflux RND transporter permease subunit, partial [Gemmatimonadaceae bacterium]|nr:efflux RND transporter permease subunit [Gemmatimonadaceae bacterium]
RITAVSASAIPLTMAITVFVMGLVGQTFNLMTLGAMAIAIGLVIDDAVVITENIARHLVLAPDRGTAVREAVQELIWPVTSSTITTVVVFLPLGLLEGVVGQFFTALSITLTIAVLVSLFLALTVIPLLSAQFLTAHDVEKAQRANSVLARITRALEALSLWYERTLARVLPRPRMVAIAALVLAVAGLVAQRLVGTAFLPEMDEGAFVLDYWTPGGTSLAESDRMVHEAERILAGIPEVDGTSRRLGAELGLFATEQNRGDLVVRLKPRAQRDRTSFEVIDTARVLIDQAVPRMRIEFVQILSDVINDLAGAAKPVEIKLFGEQLDQLETYATMLAPKIGAVDGVEDLYSGVSEPAAEMLLKVRAGEAARVGLDPEQVGAAVSGALLGVNAGEVRREDRAIGVRVRAPDSVRYDPLELGALPIVAAGAHRAVPLSSLATVTPSETRAQLERENQQQMIAITSDVSGRALGSVMRDVRGVLAANPPPAGIRVEIGGQYANQQEAFRALLIVLALAAVSVVAVMVIQFQS